MLDEFQVEFLEFLEFLKDKISKDTAFLQEIPGRIPDEISERIPEKVSKSREIPDEISRLFQENSSEEFL